MNMSCGHEFVPPSCTDLDSRMGPVELRVPEAMLALDLWLPAVQEVPGHAPPAPDLLPRWRPGGCWMPDSWVPPPGQPTHDNTSYICWSTSLKACKIILVLAYLAKFYKEKLCSFGAERPFQVRFSPAWAPTTLLYFSVSKTNATILTCTRSNRVTM